MLTHSHKVSARATGGIGHPHCSERTLWCEFNSPMDKAMR